MLKRITRLFISFLMILNTCAMTNVFADYKNPLDTGETNYYITYGIDGSLIDMNMPKDNLIQTDTHTVYTVVAEGNKYNYYHGIHPSTSIWRKVSSYGFSTSNTTSVGFSFTASIGGQNKSVSGSVSVANTVSSGFSFTINVDQTRYSKLAVYTDFHWKYIRADVIDNTSGNIVNTYYYTTAYTTAQEFRPIYKN